MATVFRIPKQNNYTVMSNRHLKDTSLSLKSKGLLSQMLSLPDNWDYTLKGLAKINKESIDAIRTAIWELEKFGYISRSKIQDSNGKFSGIEYTIHEEPQHKSDEKIEDSQNNDQEGKMTENQTNQEPDKNQNLSAAKENSLDTQQLSPRLDFPTTVEPDPNISPRLDFPMLDYPMSENPMQLNTKDINILNNQSINQQDGKSNSRESPNKEIDGLMVQNELEEIFKKCEFDEGYLEEDDVQWIKSAIEIMFYSENLSVGTAKYPQSKVRSLLHMIDSEVIATTLSILQLRKSEKPIKNIKRYFASALYNELMSADGTSLFSASI